MPSLSKQLVVIIAILCICGALYGCSQPEPPTIIGAVLVLTDANGNKIINGQDVTSGMEAALHSINDHHNDGPQFELLLRDSKADAELAKQYYRELVNLGAIAIITNFSHIAQALRSVASETKVPQLAIMATAEGLTTGTDYTFRYWTQASDQAKALLPLVQKLKVRKLGLLNIDNTYGNSVSDELVKLATQRGISTQKTVYSSTDKDLDKALNDLRGVDAISFTCFPNDVLSVATLIRNKYPDVDIIGPVSVSSPEFIDNSALEGVYAPAPLIYHDPGKHDQHTHTDLPKLLTTDLNVYTAMGYDSIMFLTSTINQAGPNSAAIMEYMSNGFVFPGLFGDIIGIPKSHHFPFPLRPAQVKNGRLVFTRR